MIIFIVGWVNRWLNIVIHEHGARSARVKLGKNGEYFSYDLSPLTIAHDGVSCRHIIKTSKCDEQ